MPFTEYTSRVPFEICTYADDIVITGRTEQVFLLEVSPP